ncbi:unnamed protein product [Cyprideis torosa]|uniref:Uncharacterized protein n=1 Tax=Cyprideis torosa TaxID=163714 RepID=A0A7R8W8F9_9CRUS|nr:unnamed protein product [Cyprideis torosa]CAG0884267.1 unnamed protein product [Cyprideis torosa]
MFRCGPASLAAVKRGEVGFSHDVSFVFSELNADILHWQEDPESDWGYTLMKTNKYHVGRFVVTKHPSRDDPYGDSDSHDITHEYKQEEGEDHQLR